MTDEVRKLTEEEEKQSIGNCYKDAWVFVREHMGDNPVLVHGSMTPPERVDVSHGSNALRNVLIDHAWVEIGDRLFDPANPGVDLTLDKFYGYFKVDKSRVKKYNFLEVLENSMESGHYGPWDD